MLAKSVVELCAATVTACMTSAATPWLTSQVEDRLILARQDVRGGSCSDVERLR